MGVTREASVLAALVAASAPAAAQPGAAPQMSASDVLRDANAAAIAGDWPRVAALVEPLVGRPGLAAAEQAEAHRLAGLAGFFQQQRAAAERHFVAYLRTEPDARLDPALYPPDVVAFFNDVASRHAAELRAQRVRPPRRTWLLALVPPVAQFQNGEPGKGLVVGGLLVGMLATNLTTYAVLSSWCDQTSGAAGGGLACDRGGDHRHGARILKPINLAAGIGFVLTYAYGVWDGVSGYRQKTREYAIQPYVATSLNDKLIGIAGSF